MDGKFKENITESIIDDIDVCVCVMDDDHNILYFNSSLAQKFKGIKSFKDISYADMPEEYKALSLYEECLKKGTKLSKKTQTDKKQYVITTTHPVLDDRENPIYYIEEILFSDIETNTHSPHTQTSFDDIVINDKAMFDINQTISRIAYFDSTILIQGESGTGKTALARHIHKNSNRADKPFVTINCGSIPENLIESELFGYASGAFTSASKKGKPGQVELADGGTLFLDEIGLLPYNLQSKFLQLIQEKTYTPVGALKSKSVDVRIISATNEDLKKFIKERKFREDLYYRLRVIELFIPPLREREDAIESLAKYFLDKYNTKFQKNKTITSTAISALKDYGWPSNIRELQYVMERIILTSDNDIITSKDIPPLHDMEKEKLSSNGSASVPDFQNFDNAVAEFEKNMLSKAYSHYKSSYKVADALGITQTKASRLLRKYNISASR